MEHQNQITDTKIIRDTTGIRIPLVNSIVGRMGQDIRDGSVEILRMVASLKQRSITVWEEIIMAATLPNQDASIIITNARIVPKNKTRLHKTHNTDQKQNQSHFSSASNHSFLYLERVVHSGGYLVR